MLPGRTSRILMNFVCLFVCSFVFYSSVAKNSAEVPRLWVSVSILVLLEVADRRPSDGHGISAEDLIRPLTT